MSGIVWKSVQLQTYSFMPCPFAFFSDQDTVKAAMNSAEWLDMTTTTLLCQAGKWKKWFASPECHEMPRTT